MSTPVIRPHFHHVNLKTSRLPEMIDWYAVVVGASVTHQGDAGAWLTNDAANHRIALLAAPDFADDPERDTRAGMHHSAFEYDGFDDLNASYERLRGEGIEPEFCLDHGMTLSYYYRDPDGNRVELQIDAFGDWAKSASGCARAPSSPPTRSGCSSTRRRSLTPRPQGPASTTSTHRRWRANSSLRRWRPDDEAGHV